MALNTVVFAAAFASNLRERLEHGIHAVFPSSARERIDLSLAEVQSVAASFADAKARAARSFAHGYLGMGVAVEALGASVESARYELSPAEFEAAADRDPIVAGMSASLLRGTEVAEALRRLTDMAADAVVQVIASEVSERLERAFLSTEFNELGALRMQEHVRAALDLLTGLERAQSVRPRFARLLQMAFLLTLERLVDLRAYEYPNSVLSPAEQRATLVRRQDFDAGAVAACVGDGPT